MITSLTIVFLFCRYDLYSSDKLIDMVWRIRRLPQDQYVDFVDDDLLMIRSDLQSNYKIADGGNFGPLVLGLDHKSML